MKHNGHYDAALSRHDGDWASLRCCISVSECSRWGTDIVDPHNRRWACPTRRVLINQAGCYTSPAVMYGNQLCEMFRVGIFFLT